MSSRFAAVIAPFALLFGTCIASAAPHGGHAGHAAPAGHAGHAGTVYHGGYGGYYPGYPYYYDHHHHNYWAVSVGLGIGLGYPYYGGGYYGGYPYYAAYPDYSYAVPVAPAVVSPESGYNTAPATNGNNTAPAASTDPAPATVTLVVSAGTKVWFDGKETGEAEGNRVFALPGIETGKSQTLSVKVEMNGSTTEMRIPLKAGDRMTLDMRK